MDNKKKKKKENLFDDDDCSMNVLFSKNQFFSLFFTECILIDSIINNKCHQSAKKLTKFNHLSMKNLRDQLPD